MALVCVSATDRRTMPPMNEKFAELGTPRRVWAVAAIHGDLERLMALHDHIATRFAVGDRLLYLGNYLGVGSPDNAAVIDELLAFRAALLAKPGMEPADIVHLRGPAEEAWQRLLRLQFAPLPTQMLERLLKAGVEPYLRLYGITLNDTRATARADSVTITRWTNQLRVAQRLTPGHEPLACSMRRAAIAGNGRDSAPYVLYVPAGFDCGRSLEDQGDNLWFTTDQLRGEAAKNVPYARIVRGFDPLRGGVVTEGKAVTLDGGCGFGGPLICAAFDPLGRILDIVTVGGHCPFESLSRHDNGIDDLDDSAPLSRHHAEQHAMTA